MMYVNVCNAHTHVYQMCGHDSLVPPSEVLNICINPKKTKTFRQVKRRLAKNIKDGIALKKCEPAHHFSLIFTSGKLACFSLAKGNVGSFLSCIMAASYHVHLPNAVFSRYAVFCRTCEH